MEVSSSHPYAMGKHGKQDQTWCVKVGECTFSGSVVGSEYYAVGRACGSASIILRAGRTSPKVFRLVHIA